MLIDCEFLDRRLLECAAEPSEWVAIVEVVEVTLVLARCPGDVEAGLASRSREGDVAPLLEPCLARAEHEGPFDRKTLRGVAGDGVRVADVARIDVVATELDDRAAVGRNDER